MKKLINKSLILIGALALSGCASTSAITNPNFKPNTPTKTYQVSNLQIVVENSTSCQSVFKDLKGFSQRPFSLQFARTTPGTNNFTLNDSQGQLKNHSFSVVQQQVNGSVVTRVGTGNFMYNNQQFQYIVAITGDVSQSNFKYLYPIIISSNNGHCYYTGILTPNASTVKTFQSGINSGAVNNATDIAN